MFIRFRSTLLAWGGALILAVSATGLVAAASLVGDVAPQDALPTFTDSNGNGIDDACEEAVVADHAAADAAVQAADLDQDGTISVSEAAQTDWTGGANCNHGGYVSTVARGSGETCDTSAPEETETGDQGKDANEAADEAPEADTGDCAADSTETASEPADTTVCDTTTPEAPTEPSADEQAPTDTAPNAHGVAVSTVAQSDAVGGKNCNHGGAVSEAAKKDHGGGPNANATKAPKGKGHRWGHGRP